MLKNRYKILVTGGAGMIGSNLVKRLVTKGYQVKIVDNLWRGKLSYLEDERGIHVINLENDFYNRDLAIPSACDDILGDVDYVIHLADIVAGIGYVFNNQGSIFRQNILINSNVISSVKNFKLKGFIYVGTACSFPAFMQNKFEAVQLKEEDLYPASPESAYGWSKLMGIYESELMELENKIPVSNLILHNVYGSPCDYSSERGQVIPSLIRKAINYPSEDFVVWGSGKQGRAFVHVDDVVDALLLSMEKGLGKGVIQIGPASCTTIKEIAETIVSISGKNINIVYDASRPEGDKSRSADYTKAKTLLGWEPKINLYEGLKKTYDWVEKQIKRNT